MILIFFVSHLGSPVLEPFGGVMIIAPFYIHYSVSPFFCLEICYRRRK